MTKVKDSERKLTNQEIIDKARREIIVKVGGSTARVHKAMYWLVDFIDGGREDASPEDAAQANYVFDLIQGLSTAAAKSGAQGGKKRAANLTPKRRSAIAKKAAAARWAK